jgi:hypothetical protein
MFEGLDDVPWEKLRCAEGAASDTPLMLRALASAEGEERQKLWRSLYSNIYHQGTVYEATAYAVPFLIELTQTPGVPDRHEILEYLYWLWHGASYLDSHRHKDNYKDKLDTPEFQEELRRELSWVTAVGDAVYAGASVYADLLDDPSPQVRACAAYLLGLGKEDAERNIGWLRRHLEEGEADDMACAACVYSVSGLAEGDPEAINWLKNIFAAGEARPAVRVAAAAGLARAMWQDAPEEVVAAIAVALRVPGAEAEVLARLPIFGSELEMLYGRALMCAGASAVPALPAMARAMERLDDWDVYPLAGMMLAIAFDGRVDSRGVAFRRLSRAQQETLRAISQSEAFWRAFDEGCSKRDVEDMLWRVCEGDKPEDLHSYIF